MTRRKRRNHSPEFKAKVAMAAIRSDRTLAELSQQYGIHADQIRDWKNRLMAEAGSLFESGASQGTADSEEKVAELHARIGELSMEGDFLSKALGHGRRASDERGLEL